MTHGINVLTTIIHKNANGKVLKTVKNKTVDKKSHLLVGKEKRDFNSFVSNYLIMMYNHFFSEDNVSGAKNTDGINAISLTNFQNIMSNSEDFGIFVGLGNTAVASADYNLETKIAEGTGLNELNYAATGVSGPVDTGTGHNLLLSRSITNNSGAQIDIKETGLIARYQNALAAINNMLFSRDVLSPLVSIADLETKTIKYNLNTAYNTTQGIHSNFLSAMKSILTGASQTAIRTDGGSSSQPFSSSMFINAAAGDSTRGLRVGTNNADFAPSQYSLQNLITNGLGDTQMQYEDFNTTNGLISGLAFSGSETSFTVGRRFTYAGNTNIDIGEYDLCAVGSQSCMLLRGKINPVINLVQGESIEVYIKIYTQV